MFVGTFLFYSKEKFDYCLANCTLMCNLTSSLTTTPPAGARVTIIKRTGKTWYDRGESTASSGVTFLENASPIAAFIAQRTTKLPE